MNKCRLLLFLAALWLNGAQAGIIVEVTDPRYFTQQQQVIFDKAEVKLVTFEVEEIGNDERGKQIAKELHNKFLANISDLHGGAIITYVTPPGRRDRKLSRSRGRRGPSAKGIDGPLGPSACRSAGIAAYQCAAHVGGTPARHQR